MTLKAHTKLAVAYSNFLAVEQPTIVTTNITGFVSGFPADNLKYEDPWTMMKTSGTNASDPTIEFQFSVGPTWQPDVCGVINHNLKTADYTSVTAQRWNGVGWDDLGTVDVAGDKDLFISWESVSPADNWRIKIDGGSVGGDFYIGSVFWGFIYDFEKNPPGSGMIQARTVPLVTEQSSGGSKHTTFGASNDSATLELSWSGGSMTDMDVFTSTFVTHELLGVLTPEIGDYKDKPSIAGYLGGQPFWGYVRDRTFSPVGPGGSQTSQRARYDYSIFLEGAV